MWRLNVQLNQYENCVKYMAHATKQRFGFEHGDVLLFQITKNSCADIHERIPCFMKYRETVKDSATIVQYWGDQLREYEYLIKGEQLTFIKPFSLCDIQSSNKHYDNQKTANSIDPADESIVKKLLQIDPISMGDDRLLPEGDIVYKWHKKIERSARNVEKVKESFYKKYGKYFCEICRFEFQKAYGCTKRLRRR